MPRTEDLIPPAASLTDIYYAGGDALGTAMLFLNPLIAFGEELYHGIRYKDDSIDKFLEDLDKRTDEKLDKIEKKEYEKEDRMRRYRIDDLNYEMGLLGYRKTLEDLAKPKAKSRTRRRNSGRKTGNDRRNVTVKVESTNTNTNTNGLDYYIKEESPEEVAKKYHGVIV